jgi:cytochrome c-type biogenesis protein CcmF
MHIEYIGEHLVAGSVGKALVWVSFATALIAAVLYLLAFYGKGDSKKWRSGARLLYLLHTGSLLAVGGVLYYFILNHYFEYSYVWQYSSTTLPLKYIVSCFWAGQEGSFLVWALWQALVGVILLFISRKWESPVMAVFSLSQGFVTSMLLGISIGGLKIGASPFTLLRDTVDTISGTIFTQADYLTILGDGNGLNPLLENIWMTIHPPILFLGYALALVPFAYAVSSFMKKDYHTWIGRAFPWTLMALTMLGAGILLGGAWAYVSLTFGGFWTWDPVENSSLVPWMTLVAGLHFMLIARKQNFALLAAYLLIGLSYVLVLYASFLTRSGVLADTSAHSFGDNGMTVQLLIFLLTFFVMIMVLIFRNVKKFNSTRKEILLSREFWMFVGGIVIVLSAFQILFTTSIPVINSLFSSEMAPPADVTGHYNRWQMPYAMLIAGFIAMSQFLSYNNNEPGTLLKRLWFPLAVSILLTIPFFVMGIVSQLSFLFFIFFILFAIVASIWNLTFNRALSRNWAAIITHLGFAFFLLGTVLTFSNSKVISSNTSRYDLGDEQMNRENLFLIKNDTLYMSGYYVAYVDNRKEGNTTVYRVDFMKFRNGKYILDFSLNPSVNVHPSMGAVYNPDTRHLLDKDYYTYIATVAPDNQYIVIKAIMNPYINVLWFGSLVMVLGFGYAFLRRARRRWFSNT